MGDGGYGDGKIGGLKYSGTERLDNGKAGEWKGREKGPGLR